MHLPWKKSSISRFSRIMADLQQPSRGNPLVIETGFPTSVVDLFYKNQQRLKKPSSKKRWMKNLHSNHQQEQELVIPDPIPFSNSRDFGVLLLDNGRRVENHLMGHQQQKQNFNGCQLMSELSRSPSPCPSPCPSPTERCVDVDAVDGKHLLWVLLKMLVVVVLGLSSKQLVVGMTMAAVVLVFMEYVWKHVFCVLTQPGNALLLIFKRQKKNSAGYDTMFVVPEEEDTADSCDFVELVEEIHVEEYYRAVVAHLEGNRIPDIDFGLVDSRGRLECLEPDTKVVGIQKLDEGRIEVVVSEKGRGRGTRIRSTIIKKLVPKKLRGRRKCKMIEGKELDFSSEESSCCGGNQIEIVEALEEHENHGRQGLEVYRVQKSLQELLEEEEQSEKERKCTDSDDGSSISSREVQAPAPVVLHFLRKNAESKGKGKSSSCYLILCVIVLAGLLGGRVVALMITVVSCLILKFVKNRSPASL